MTAVLFISHGSHSPQTKKEVVRLVKTLKSKSGIKIFEYAFLEIESPDIPEGIDRCVKKGAMEIIVLLNFLNSGRHVNQDIPRIVQEAKAQYPGVSISMTSPVGQHAGIMELFLDLVSPRPAKGGIQSK